MPRDTIELEKNLFGQIIEIIREASDADIDWDSHTDLADFLQKVISKWSEDREEARENNESDELLNHVPTSSTFVKLLMLSDHEVIKKRLTDILFNWRKKESETGGLLKTVIRGESWYGKFETILVWFLYALREKIEIKIGKGEKEVPVFDKKQADRAYRNLEQLKSALIERRTTHEKKEKIEESRRKAEKRKVANMTQAVTYNPVRFTRLKYEWEDLIEKFKQILKAKYRSEVELAEVPWDVEFDVEFIILNDERFDDWIMAGKSETFVFNGDDSLVACTIVESFIDGKTWLLRFSDDLWVKDMSSFDDFLLSTFDSMKEAVQFLLDEMSDENAEWVIGLYGSNQLDGCDNWETLKEKLHRLLS